MIKTVPPVKKNQTIDVFFEDLTHDGAGVAKVEGYPIFVPGGIPQEKANIKIVKVNKGYAYGKLLHITEQSKHRIASPCPIFSECGGCQLQHMDYDMQLQFKRKQVNDVLKRIGKLDNYVLHPVLGMDEPWRYRNKAQVPIGEEEGGLIAGFYRKGTHDIINMDSCLIQAQENDDIVNKVKEIIGAYGIRAYNEKKHQGTLRHIMVRYSHATKEVMLVLITKNEQIPNKKNIIGEITQALPQVKSIIQNVNPKRTNVIFGDKTKVLWGGEYLYDSIGDIKFAISARSFYQVNPLQTKVLYEKALEYAALSGKETVIDAYCGIGTITLFLAQQAKKVYGVEIVPEAIEDAKRNAALNKMQNVEFAVGEAEVVIPNWYKQGIQADVIVVDPPRKGCDGTLLQTMLDMKPRRIVYVSCNPATLARDLRVLEDGGYKTVEVQPVDMFPHTMHCEAVVRIEFTKD